MSRQFFGRWQEQRMPVGIMKDSDRNLRGHRIRLDPGKKGVVAGVQTTNNQPVVVTIWIDARALTGQPDLIFAKAIIDWGTEGGDHRAEVDVVNGSSFVVGGSFIRVAIENVGTVPAEFGGALAYGNSSALLPQRTFQQTNPIILPVTPPWGVRTQTIPSFARYLNVSRFPNNTGYRIQTRPAVLALAGPDTEIVVPAGAELAQITGKLGLQIPDRSRVVVTQELIPTGLRVLNLIFDINI